MRNLIRSLPIALATVCLAASFHVASGHDAFAQAKSAPAQASPADAPQLKQIPLTDKQVQSVLAAQKEMDALSEKLPDDPDAQPDSRVMAQLDGVAKKYGFADYGDYTTVVDNITLVLGGFDPQTKTYIGAEAVLKKQIAAVEADNKIPSKEKKQALDDMNAALKMPAPAIENKGNIDLVTKYYDKLADLFSDNGDD